MKVGSWMELFFSFTDLNLLQVAHLALLTSFPFFSVTSASFILSVIMVNQPLLLHFYVFENLKKYPHPSSYTLSRSWSITIWHFHTLARIIILLVRWALCEQKCQKIFIHCKRFAHFPGDGIFHNMSLAGSFLLLCLPFCKWKCSPYNEYHGKVICHNH